MAQLGDSLFTEPTDNPSTGLGSSVVTTCLQIIEDHKTSSITQLNKLDDIQGMMNDTFNADDPNGNVQLPAYLLFQVVFNLVTQMKPLDIQVTTQNISEEKKRVVSQGLEFVAKEAGYADLFNTNYNGFWKQLTQGDFFALVDEKINGLPQFKPCNVTGLYFDSNATNLRTGGSNGLTRAVVVFEMGLDEAIAQMPWIKDKATVGSLPSTSDWEEYQDLNEMEWEQDALADKRRIEIGYYFDISDKPRFTIIAGKTAAIGVDLKGDDYPYYLGEGDKKEYYIPLLQWLCFPTQEGIMNAGFGHIIYPLAKKMQELTNKAINHVQDNMDPTRIINVPKQQAPRFLSRVKDAQNMKKKGQRPMIINDFGQGELGQGVGAVETLQAPQMTADFERLVAIFKQNLTAFGVNIDSINIDPNKPLGSVEIEQENRSEIIRQIQEGNTGTYRFAMKILMDKVMKLNETTDKETLDIKTPVSLMQESDRELFEQAGQEVPFTVYTIRDLKEDLESAEWDIIVNSRSGSYPSFTLEKARLRNAVNDMIAIGETDQAKRLLVKQHKLSGINLDFSQAPQQQAKQVGEEAPQAELGALEAA